MRAQLIALAILGLAACAQAETATVETQVDPNSVASDFRGITGTVERFTVASTRVTTRDVEVWLPPSYALNSDRQYPVLYMHDGQNLFDPEQSKYAKWDWGIDEALTALIADERVPEVIVVGIHSDEATRNIDYFPQKAGNEHTEAFQRDFGTFDTAALNADNYLDFLITEIKPRIDATYRTKPGREDTTVMGSSMGGLISLYAISEYPEVFGAAGMVSTHFPLADGVLVDYFADKLPDPSTHRLYFDFGTETLDHNYEAYQDRMDRAVEAAGYARGVNWTTRKYEGHDHSERAWRNRVHVPLQFLLAKDNVAGGETR
jgi:predicted alpha/beta superfamily hydrolase